MELYQLQSLVTVAQESHLTRAAEALHISQPAVSAHIKALEEELNQPLFLRTPRGMVLTPGGKLLCEKAKEILAGVDSLAALGERLRRQPAGRVKIGLNRYSEFLHITELYQRLRDTQPHIEISLHQAVSGTIVKMIRNNGLDCGFILGDCRGDDLKRILLAGLRLRVVGPIAMREKITTATLADLMEMPWIGTPQDCPYTQIMESFFYSRGIKPKIKVVADQQSAITSMIEAGVGLNFMLDEEAAEAEEQGKLAIWPGDSFPIDLSFAFRTKNQHSPVVRAVVDQVKIIWRREEGLADEGGQQ